MNNLIFTEHINDELSTYLGKHSYSAIHILTDTNTAKHCLPLLKVVHPAVSNPIIVPPGDEHKSYQSCEIIWEHLLSSNADRKALLINLGGGMITDLGGFAASVFKRGVSFINIPTSLMAMADAAIGGKTAINFQNSKNQLGSFSFADAVLIDTGFLKTLPKRELLSGYAEILKYGLIYRKELWDRLKGVEVDTIHWHEIINEVALIKTQIVEADPYEKGLRKILNFGHTIGHALESHSLTRKTNPLLHGEAVAAGMIAEAFLSLRRGLPEGKMKEISSILSSLFPAYAFAEADYEDIFQFIRQDKKNQSGGSRFTLLQDIGKATTDVPVTENEIIEALDFYRSICKA